MIKDGELTLIDLVKTKDDVSDLISEIDMVIAAFYKYKVDAVDVFDTLVSYDKKDTLLSMMRIQHIAITNTPEVQKFLQQLKTQLQQLPIVLFVLAKEPRVAFIKTLSHLLVEKTKKPMVIDIMIDRSVIGGAIISYNGRFKDYSLKKKLQEKVDAGDLKTIMRIHE